jgi:hypothetical protein
MRKSDFIFRYRVRNWRDYNQALVRRGSITFWVDEQAVRFWRAERVPGARGRPQLYADTAIECALVVKAVFHLSLRSTQGFLESVVRLMEVDLPVPDYTTVCKRQRHLRVQLGAKPATQPRHVVIDTTGLRVLGAGEWYVRKHGMERGRRRIWRKLHLGVDEKTKDIVAVDLTTSGVHDSPHMPDVLDLVHDPAHQVSGDSAYDIGACYQAIVGRGAVPTIPPRRNARLSTAKDPPPFRAERDAVIERIKEEGRYSWRTSSGATRQSLAENAVSRFKALLGVKLAAREFDNQRVEALVKCRVLNRMSSLGLPISERVLQG